jgi:hypothetical protein
MSAEAWRMIANCGISFVVGALFGAVYIAWVSYKTQQFLKKEQRDGK